LLKKVKAMELKKATTAPEGGGPSQEPGPASPNPEEVLLDQEPAPTEGSNPVATKPTKTSIRLHGSISTELWNRFGRSILPKMRSGEDLKIALDMTSTFENPIAIGVRSDLQHLLEDLDPDGSFEIE
jgi:hypothetical protein